MGLAQPCFDKLDNLNEFIISLSLSFIECFSDGPHSWTLQTSQLHFSEGLYLADTPINATAKHTTIGIHANPEDAIENQ